MNFSALAMHTNKHPCEGGKFVRCPCDFSVAQSYLVDLSLLQNLGGIQDLQTCFIDAFESSADVTLTMIATGQRIVCPAGKQGIFPVFFAGDSAQFSVACSDTSALVTVFICNQPCIVPCVWLNTQSNVIEDSDNNPITDSDGNVITGS